MFRFCVSALLSAALLVVAVTTPHAEAGRRNRWQPSQQISPLSPVVRPVARPVVPAPDAGEPTQSEVGWNLRDEIARRGNMVEHITPTEGNAEDDGDWAVTEATALPPDDSHKWFITVISMRNCKYCDDLRYDFANSPELQPWVNVQDYKKSWAHYQVISIDDQTQKWRFEGNNPDGTPRFKPRVFPTLLVQPPMNGSFGSPTTRAVTIEGYDGDAKKLALKLQKGVQAYARAKANVHRSYVETGALIEAKEEIPEGKKFIAPFTTGGAEQSEAVKEEAPNAEQAKADAKAGGYSVEGPNAPFDVPVPLPTPTPQPYLPNAPMPFDPMVDPSEGVTLTAFGSMVMALLGKLLGSEAVTKLLVLIGIGIAALAWLAPRTKTTIDDRILAALNQFFVRKDPAPTTTAA